MLSPTKDAFAYDYERVAWEEFSAKATPALHKSGRNLHRYAETLVKNDRERTAELRELVAREAKERAERERAERDAELEEGCRRKMAAMDHESQAMNAWDRQTRRRLARKEFLRLEAIDREKEAAAREVMAEADRYSAAREAKEKAARERAVRMAREREERTRMLELLAREEADMHEWARAQDELIRQEELARQRQAEADKARAAEEAKRDWEMRFLLRKQRAELASMYVADQESRAYMVSVKELLEREARNRRLDAERRRVIMERRAAEEAAKRKEEARLKRLEAKRQRELEEAQAAEEAHFARVKDQLSPIVAGYLVRHGRAHEVHRVTGKHLDDFDRDALANLKREMGAPSALDLVDSGLALDVHHQDGVDLEVGGERAGSTVTVPDEDDAW